MSVPCTCLWPMGVSGAATFGNPPSRFLHKIVALMAWCTWLIAKELAHTQRRPGGIATAGLSGLRVKPSQADNQFPPLPCKATTPYETPKRRKSVAPIGLAT